MTSRKAAASQGQTGIIRSEKLPPLNGAVVLGALSFISFYFLP
jgi:hypothetical protein